MMISRSPRARKMSSSDDCSKNSARRKRICAPRSRNCRAPAAQLFVNCYSDGRFAAALFVIRYELFVRGMKADLSPRRSWRKHQLADGVEDNLELRVILVFEISELTREIGIREKHLA